MARQLTIDVAELSKVINTTQQTTQAYASVETQRLAAINAPLKPGGPTAAQINAQMQLKTLYTTFDGVVTLSQTLSSASWKALHAYIIGTYKTTIYKK